MMIDETNNDCKNNVDNKIISSSNFLSNEQISIVSTGSSDGNETKIRMGETANEENVRFSLRKRRNVNYNLKTKKFEYEEDSDYEEKTRRKEKKKNKKVKNETVKKIKNVKLRNSASSSECREFQLSGLLNWKNYDVQEEVQQGESESYEFEDICNVNLEKYCEDLEAILINPPWSNNGNKFNFNMFTKLKLPLNKMKEGLIFVWTEKEFISDVVNYFENQKIKYVENVVWVVLDPKLNESSSNTTDPFKLNNIFKVDPYTNFSKSHKTLLMFRKFLPSNKRYLELRHQRTGDAVFDYDNQDIPNYKPFYYIYRLIEILLPKANYKQDSAVKNIRGKDGYISFKNKNKLN